MKTIASFYSPEDAYLFRSFMASRGIRTSVLDEYISQLFWHYRQATGGVRVVLEDDEDLPAAEPIAREYFSALAPAPVEEVRGWPVVALLSLVIGVPMLIFGRKALEKKDVLP